MVFNCNKSVLENTSSRRFNLCSGTCFVYFYSLPQCKIKSSIEKGFAIDKHNITPPKKRKDLHDFTKAGYSHSIRYNGVL